MRTLGLVIAATGCSQVFGLDSPLHRDAAGDGVADIAVDQYSPNTTCFAKWQLGPMFAAPTLVSGVSTSSNESDPFLTPDGLQLYFQRSGDFYLATRPSTLSSFDAGAQVTSLSSGVAETKLFVDASGTRAWFASQRAGGAGGFDLWRGTRSVQSQMWSVDQMYLGIVNTPEEQHDPYLSPDLLHLYYAPLQVAGQTIVLSTRGSIGDAFGAPTAIAALDGAGYEADPAVSDDEHLIVFTSTRTGRRRLVYATRPTANAPFSTPAELTVLNADIAEGDGDPHLTADGCTLYWSSARSGAGDIYTSTML